MESRRMATRTLPQITPRQLGERCCDSDVQPSMTMAEAERATADLEILAHPIRLQLLDVLARKEGEVCVCDLEGAVPVKQPTVSHHLKLLRAAGLVHSERQGLYAYYRIDREALGALRARITGRLATLG
jgi:ArsR family transcriptional regulator, arsenate/arsenite/antimonite-responsive transcriptional repressor